MRPFEWLLELAQRQDAYERLLCERGLAGAAWKIASARCQAAETAMPVPTRTEVRTAAHELALKLGLDEVPTSTMLRRECEQQGLLVL